MSLEPQVAFKNVDPSDAVLDWVQAHLDGLARRVPGLRSCRVVFERPLARNVDGDLLRIDLVLALQGGAEVAISHQATSDRRVDPAEAVRDAFAIIERRLAETAHARGLADRRRPSVIEWEQP